MEVVPLPGGVPRPYPLGHGGGTSTGWCPTPLPTRPWRWYLYRVVSHALTHSAMEVVPLPGGVPRPYPLGHGGGTSTGWCPTPLPTRPWRWYLYRVVSHALTHSAMEAVPLLGGVPRPYPLGHGGGTSTGWCPTPLPTRPWRWYLYRVVSHALTHSAMEVVPLPGGVPRPYPLGHGGGTSTGWCPTPLPTRPWRWYLYRVVSHALTHSAMEAVPLSGSVPRPYPLGHGGGTSTGWCPTPLPTRPWRRYLYWVVSHALTHSAMEVVPLPGGVPRPYPLGHGGGTSTGWCPTPLPTRPWRRYLYWVVSHALTHSAMEVVPLPGGVPRPYPLGHGGGTSTGWCPTPLPTRPWRRYLYWVVSHALTHSAMEVVPLPGGVPRPYPLGHGGGTSTGWCPTPLPTRPWRRYLYWVVSHALTHSAMEVVPLPGGVPRPYPLGHGGGTSTGWCPTPLPTRPWRRYLYRVVSHALTHSAMEVVPLPGGVPRPYPLGHGGGTSTGWCPTPLPTRPWRRYIYRVVSHALTHSAMEVVPLPGGVPRPYPLGHGGGTSTGWCPTPLPTRPWRWYLYRVVSHALTHSAMEAVPLLGGVPRPYPLGHGGGTSNRVVSHALTHSAMEAVPLLGGVPRPYPLGHGGGTSTGWCPTPLPTRPWRWYLYRVVSHALTHSAMEAVPLLGGVPRPYPLGHGGGTSTGWCPTPLPTRPWRWYLYRVVSHALTHSAMEVVPLPGGVPRPYPLGHGGGTSTGWCPTPLPTRPWRWYLYRVVSHALTHSAMEAVPLLGGVPRPYPLGHGGGTSTGWCPTPLPTRPWRRYLYWVVSHALTHSAMEAVPLLGGVPRPYPLGHGGGTSTGWCPTPLPTRPWRRYLYRVVSHALTHSAMETVHLPGGVPRPYPLGHGGGTSTGWCPTPLPTRPWRRYLYWVVSHALTHSAMEVVPLPGGVPRPYPLGHGGGTSTGWCPTPLPTRPWRRYLYWVVSHALTHSAMEAVPLLGGVPRPYPLGHGGGTSTGWYPTPLPTRPWRWYLYRVVSHALTHSAMEAVPLPGGVPRPYPLGHGGGTSTGWCPTPLPTRPWRRYLYWVVSHALTHSAMEVVPLPGGVPRPYPLGHGGGTSTGWCPTPLPTRPWRRYLYWVVSHALTHSAMEVVPLPGGVPRPYPLGHGGGTSTGWCPTPLPTRPWRRYIYRVVSHALTHSAMEVVPLPGGVPRPYPLGHGGGTSTGWCPTPLPTRPWRWYLYRVVSHALTHSAMEAVPLPGGVPRPYPLGHGGGTSTGWCPTPLPTRPWRRYLYWVVSHALTHSAMEVVPLPGGVPRPYPLGHGGGTSTGWCPTPLPTRPWRRYLYWVVSHALTHSAMEVVPLPGGVPRPYPLGHGGGTSTGWCPTPLPTRPWRRYIYRVVSHALTHSAMEAVHLPGGVPRPYPLGHGGGTSTGWCPTPLPTRPWRRYLYWVVSHALTHSAMEVVPLPGGVPRTYPLGHGDGTSTGWCPTPLPTRPWRRYIYRVVSHALTHSAMETVHLLGGVPRPYPLGHGGGTSTGWCPTPLPTQPWRRYLYRVVSHALTHSAMEAVPLPGGVPRPYPLGHGGGTSTGWCPTPLTTRPRRRYPPCLGGARLRCVCFA